MAQAFLKGCPYMLSQPRGRSMKAPDKQLSPGMLQPWPFRTFGTENMHNRAKEPERRAPQSCVEQVVNESRTSSTDDSCFQEAAACI